MRYASGSSGMAGSIRSTKTPKKDTLAGVRALTGSLLVRARAPARMLLLALACQSPSASEGFLFVRARAPARVVLSALACQSASEGFLFVRARAAARLV